MEAAAIGSVAELTRIPHMIVMKGVMDHADEDKQDGFKVFAARASAECLIAFLREYLPIDTDPSSGRSDDALGPGGGSADLGMPTQAVSTNIATTAPQSTNLNYDAPSHNAYDAELDEARDRLRNGESALAISLMDRIRARHWDHLTSRQRFRLLVNKGSALSNQGDFAPAARCLVEAEAQQPADPEAQGYGAVGLEMLGRGDEAYVKAGQILRTAPSTIKAAAVRARSAPPTKLLDELLQEMSPAAINAEVSVALALRALAERNFVRASEFAAAATLENPEWSAAWLVRGKVALANEIVKLDDRKPSDKQGLEQALQYFTFAVDRARDQLGHPAIIDALLSRAQVNAMLGVSRDSDIEEAYRLAPDDSNVLENFATLVLERGHTKTATNYLRRAVSHGASSRAKFMLGVTLWKESTDSSRAEATSLFADVARNDDGASRVDAAVYALKGLCAQGLWDQAERLVLDVSSELGLLNEMLLRSSIALARKEIEECRRLALEASSHVTAETSRNSITHLAALLSKIDLQGEALALWQRIFDPNHYSLDAHNLIACAEALGRDDIALDACRQLRANGQAPPALIAQEAALLERYDPVAAVNLLQAHLQTTPRDSLARLRLSTIGLRIGRPELVSASEHDIPDPADIEPEWIPAILAILETASDARLRLRYAYRALRAHFGSHQAHAAYFHTMTPSSRPMPRIEEPTIATVGCAVCIREDGSSDKWFVLEDEPDTMAELQELRTDDRLATKLIGKKVSEKVVIAESDIQHRTAVVTQVVSKYVYRYRDVLDNWQLRFPNEPGVQMFRLETAQETILTSQFEPILRVVDAYQKRVDEVLSAYKVNPMPMHIVAEALGRSDVSMTMALAVDPNSQVRVGDRDVSYVAGVFERLDGGAQLVLDPSALATILLLQKENLLGSLSLSPKIPYSVNDDCNQMVREVTTPSAGSMKRVPGGHAFQEIPEAHRLASVEKLNEQLAAIRRVSSLVGCPELASIAPERRKELVNLFGNAGAEALVVSAVRNHLLWTDDMTMMFAAQHYFDCTSITTELLIRYMSERAKIKSSEYDAACAKLVAARYVPTPVSPAIFVEAARLSLWNPGSSPLAEMLELFADDAFSADGVVAVTCRSMPLLFIELLAPDQPSAAFTIILTSLLDRVTHRRDGFRVVRGIRQGFDLTFGLNVIGLAETTQIVDAWINHRRQ